MDKNTARKLEVLDMVIEDVANDAKEFDGKPFDGRTVAEYLGKTRAAIAALARILKSEIEQNEQQSQDQD